MFVRILSIALFLFIALVLGIGMFKSEEFYVSKSIVINAEDKEIYPYLNNLQKGQKWSPWAEEDSDIEYTFPGKVYDEGAIINWTGDKVGQGQMMILESSYPNLVKLELEVLKPYKSISTVEYRVESIGPRKNKVTWVMYGTRNFQAKVISVFMNCETKVSKKFEKGLENLKSLVEKN